MLEFGQSTGQGSVTKEGRDQGAGAGGWTKEPLYWGMLDFLLELGHNNAKASCNAEKRGLIWILG